MLFLHSPFGVGQGRATFCKTQFSRNAKACLNYPFAWGENAVKTFGELAKRAVIHRGELLFLCLKHPY